MAKQFEPEIEKKAEDVTDAKETAQKRIEDLAEKAAEKSSKTENQYDKDHNLISH